MLVICKSYSVLVLLGILTAVVPLEALGSAAAVQQIMGAHRNLLDPPEELIPSQGEAFVKVSSGYFRDGPVIRICEDGLFALRDACAKRERIIPPWYSLRGVYYEYEPVNDGVTPQEYLDLMFGVGKTDFQGLSPARRGSLYIFYNMID